MTASLKLGFLGAGKMATALAGGFVRAGLVRAGDIMASDPSPGACAAFAEKVGATTTSFNPDAVRFANVLLLAVKPDQVPAVLAGIREGFSDNHLLISIAAGVTLASLESALGTGARVIRVMPNTPALVGASATAFAAGKSALPEDCALAQRLFSSVGLSFQLKESLLDAVTGLSDGGVAAGLPREIATRLAAQTVLGSAKMVLDTGEHPGLLKDGVTSPGGTTIEGLHQLEIGKLRGTVISAVRAAAEKSKKLGQG